MLISHRSMLRRHLSLPVQLTCVSCARVWSWLLTEEGNFVMQICLTSSSDACRFSGERDIFSLYITCMIGLLFKLYPFIIYKYRCIVTIINSKHAIKKFNTFHSNSLGFVTFRIHYCIYFFFFTVFFLLACILFIVCHFLFVSF